MNGINARTLLLLNIKRIKDMKVTVVVEKQPGVRNCSCFLEKDVDDKHGLAGYGPTVDEAVKDLLAARQEYIDKDGVDMPELEMSFKYDIWAFFDKFPLNASLVAKQIGINPSLMRQYISGNKKPSEKRVDQIQKGIRELGKSLSNVSLVRF